MCLLTSKVVQDTHNALTSTPTDTFIHPHIKRMGLKASLYEYSSTLRGHITYFHTHSLFPLFFQSQSLHINIIRWQLKPPPSQCHVSIPIQSRLIDLPQPTLSSGAGKRWGEVLFRRVLHERHWCGEGWGKGNETVSWGKCGKVVKEADILR